MVLSPNDEVANSSKKHTQFKTGRHKPYPVSDQNGRNLCPVSTSGAAHSYAAYIRTTAGAKNALQIMSLAAYASETNKVKTLEGSVVFRLNLCSVSMI